jgi:hypothetical protein
MYQTHTCKRERERKKDKQAKRDKEKPKSSDVKLTRSDSQYERCEVLTAVSRLRFLGLQGHVVVYGRWLAYQRFGKPVP